MYLVGIDIGGTKTAVTLGKIRDNNSIELLERLEFATISGDKYVQTLDKIEELSNKILRYLLLTWKDIAAVGISCGGPLDSRNGVILSPPNLLGWDNVPIVDYFQERFHVPVAIQNDANACALAEWKWGAGKGTNHMIFLTFGTGLGAGLIFNGQLYNGASGMAGEVGHIRLESQGPVGFGKRGSFEGFCSGGGIAQIAKTVVLEKKQQGIDVPWCRTDMQWDDLTAKTVAQALFQDDPTAKKIMQEVGLYLGKGLSIMIDMLNPEKIIIGSIFVRQHEILAPIVQQVIQSEVLLQSSRVCQVVPAGLGEKLGDYAALSVAYEKAVERKEQGGMAG
ncbi:ROK family protein [Neobacillus ginsengisoli]|uniref:Glucokinase n=1 Tax=Neobacillus ginsengisoli TaxID=904295 RepID=A0ABT9XXK1_9BACI|nr:ROK family protein [Neobacillus ginsengisoli]MDQ0200297.1 glucokinase [Neobacillus ginsengisoli]